MPQELTIFLTAMAPMSELRGSIPLGIFIFDQPWWKVFGISIIGNLLPIPVLLWGLHRSDKWLYEMPYPLGPLVHWWDRYLKRRYNRIVQRYGVIALGMLVSIPLPFTGAWTGTLVAWVFKLPVKMSVLSIGIGVVIAGILITTMSVAGLEIFLRDEIT